MKFATILCDPPWAYQNWSARGIGKGAAGQYATQGQNYLSELPIQELAAPACVLLLWATNPLLPEAFALIESWGFTYKSKITWVKMSRHGALRIGCGYQVRSCSEELLIAGRGNVPAPAPANRPHGVIFHPSGEHSRKPDFQYDLAENYPGPYLEMFHRPRGGGLFSQQRPGWTYAGNEVDGQDMRDALRAMAVVDVSGGSK